MHRSIEDHELSHSQWVLLVSYDQMILFQAAMSVFAVGGVKLNYNLFLLRRTQL